MTETGWDPRWPAVPPTARTEQIALAERRGGSGRPNVIRVAPRRLLRDRALWALTAPLAAFEWKAHRNIPGSWWLRQGLYRRAAPKAPFRFRLGGVWYVLDPSDTMITPTAFAGRFEVEEVRALKRLAREGSIFADIGANFGYFALRAAKWVGSRGRALAFEPEPSNFNRLAQGAWENRLENISLYQMALSDAAGEGALFLDAKNGGAHSLRELNVSDPKGRLAVRTDTLDNVLQRWEACDRVDVIKMDAQGAEGRILAGARRTFERHRPSMLMEFWPDGLLSFGTDPEALLEQFLALDYHIRVLNSNDGELAAASPPDLVHRLSHQSMEANLVLTPQ